jgi:hypothetical protein
MRAKTMLQPTLSMAANTIQEARFVKAVGHGKSAVVIVNVYRNQTTATTTFDIETASQTGVNASTATFWKSVVSGGGNTIASGTTGAIKFKLADLGEFIRFNITCATWSSGMDFDITVYFADT